METIYDFRAKEDFRHDVFANEEIPDAVTVLQQFETPIFSLGDVSTITGMAKSRKTFLITSIIVAFLSDTGFLGMNSDLPTKRVLLIDTEQSRAFVQRLIRRIYRLMKWNFEDDVKDRLRVLSLRELTPEKRLEVVKNTIETFKPTLVFIDGSADLINDTNNVEDSTMLVNELMRISTDEKCHICSVVHTNPNSEKTRGHFGSELQRKSETVMLVTREGDTTTVKPQFTRNMEFAPFSFIINEFGLPEQTEIVKPKEENLQAIFEEIYSYSSYLSYGDLRDKLMEVTGKGKTACENRIKRGVQSKYIYKDMEGLYRLNVEPEETSLPFTEIDNDRYF
jgi:hypothetical protein